MLSQVLKQSQSAKYKLDENNFLNGKADNSMMACRQVLQSGFENR